MVTVQDLERLGGGGDLEHGTVLWELYFGDFLVLLMCGFLYTKITGVRCGNCQISNLAGNSNCLWRHFLPNLILPNVERCQIREFWHVVTYTVNLYSSIICNLSTKHTGKSKTLATFG